MTLFEAQQLRQGVGYILHWQSIADAMAGDWTQAKAKIEESIEIFGEVGAYNFIPRLDDKERLPPDQALSWLVEMLRKALAIREFMDVYWACAAMPYVLLAGRTPSDGPLPQPVALAAQIRGFTDKNMEYGQSAFMCALVHDEVEAMLAQWPQSEIDTTKARGRSQEIWAFAMELLDVLDVTVAFPHR